MLWHWLVFHIVNLHCLLLVFTQSSSDKIFSILLYLHRSAPLVAVFTLIYSDLCIFPPLVSSHGPQSPQSTFDHSEEYWLQHFSTKQMTTCTKRTEDMSSGLKQDIELVYE
jgi:hypothetical protein